ncbi:MAG: hypothetical protein WKG00_03610 [Polyangiaceae bacterium]
MPEAPPDDEERSVAERGAPHGVTLFDHARISAEVAEADRSQAAILESHGLTEAQWNEATQYWMRRMGDDVMQNQQHARVPLLYSDAFSGAQDALKPLPRMDIEGYATLVAAIQNTGSPAPPLAARALSMADYLRASRHFARLMAADAAQAQRFFEILQALQPAAEEVELE